MPRFYFNYRGPDDRLIEDLLGSEQADVNAAEQEAQLLARELLIEELQGGESPCAPRCFEVENEEGEVVLYLPFWAAFAAERRTDPTIH